MTKSQNAKGAKLGIGKFGPHVSYPFLDTAVLPISGQIKLDIHAFACLQREQEKSYKGKYRLWDSAFRYESDDIESRD